PQRPAGQLLAWVNRKQAGADDLRHVSRLVQRQRDECRQERLEPILRERAPDLWQTVPDEEQLQKRRRRAEDPAVEEHEAAHRPEAAASTQREKEADHAGSRQRNERQLEREKRPM